MTSVPPSRQPPALGASLQRAAQLLQAGYRDEAESLYRDLLARHPGNADALHGLAVLQQQRGSLEAALELLEQAHAARRGDAFILLDLGNAYAALGKLDDAERCYRRALKRAPQVAPLYFNLGNLLAQRGQLDEAERCYVKVLAQHPDNADVHVNLGNAYAQMKRLADAETHYRQALAADPGRVEIHVNLAELTKQQRDYDAAETAITRALAQDPDSAMLRLQLGRVLSRTRREEAALAHFEAVVGLDPLSFDAHAGLAEILHDRGRPDDAIAAYRRALDIKPDALDTLNNLGLLLTKLGRNDEAETIFRNVLAKDSRAVGSLGNLALLLIGTWRLGEAEDCLARALAIEPDHARSLNAFAHLRRVQGRYEEAMRLCERALAQDPGLLDAEMTWSTLALATANWRAGWTHYAARLPRRHYVEGQPEVRFATALPEDIAGRTILLVNEQGLGDELFFLRFAPRLRERGARICYRSSAKLSSVLRRVACLDSVLEEGRSEALPPFDHAMLIGDLPLALGAFTDLPRPLPLTALPVRLESMRRRLAQLGAPPYLGVTWRAGTPLHEQFGKKAQSLFKDAPLEELAGALRTTPGTLLALQRHPHEGEIAAFGRALGRPLHNLSAANEDLEDMLALLTLADEYVGVSNTNMHLRAGVGRTARVLVPCPPEWRWMASGDESPWFPGFRIYRQKPDGDWSAALARLRDDLLATGNKE